MEGIRPADSGEINVDDESRIMNAGAGHNFESDAAIEGKFGQEMPEDWPELERIVSGLTAYQRLELDSCLNQAVSSVRELCTADPESRAAIEACFADYPNDAAGVLKRVRNKLIPLIG
jgi:hypothetical protein